MRFLHTADWQLGMTRHFLDADAQARFTAARMEAITRIGQFARQEGCAFVLVCGDVFESNALPHRVVARALEAMKEAGVPFYLLPGNHDPLDAASLYDAEVFTSSCPPNVHVLRSADPVPVGPDLHILPAPWYSKHPDHDVLAPALQALHETDPHAQGAAAPRRIIAGHGAVDTLNPDTQDPALIRTEALQENLADGALAYVALGDRHSTTEVHPAIAYSGAPEVTDFVESDPGNVLLVDISHDRATWTAHRVGTWAFRDLTFELDDASDVQHMDAALADLRDKPRTVLRLTLRGTLTLAAHARMEQVLQDHQATFASLQVWQRRSDVAVHVGSDDLVDLEVGGFVQDAVTELGATAAADGPQQVQARDALALLYRLAGQR